MDLEQFNDRYKKLNHKAQQFRGVAIDKTVYIEHTIGDICSKYFTANETKGDQLMEAVFRRNTFNVNLEVFKYILLNGLPDVKEKFPNLIKQIETIKDLRNRLAHSGIDRSRKALEKYDANAVEIYFIKNGKKDVKTLTNEDVKGHIELFDSVSEALTRIWFYLSLGDSRSLDEKYDQDFLD